MEETVWKRGAFPRRRTTDANHDRWRKNKVFLKYENLKLDLELKKWFKASYSKKGVNKVD